MQPEGMTKASYAAHAGLTRGRVTQLTKPGEQLHKAMLPNGRINAALADKIRGLNFDPGNNKAKPSPTSVPQIENGDEPEEEDEDALLLRKSRGRIAEADADYKIMRNLEKAGELVDRAVFVGRQTDRLKALFDSLRSGKNLIVDRLISDGLLAGDQQLAARLAIGEEINKVIEDWRRGIRDPLDA